MYVSWNDVLYKYNKTKHSQEGPCVTPSMGMCVNLLLNMVHHCYNSPILLLLFSFK